MARGGDGLTIHKFGGASLADADAVRHAISLAKEAAGPAAVVASALAGVTDALTEAAGSVGGNEARIREIAEDLEKRHRRCVLAVVPAGPARRALLDHLDSAFE